jgi:hypothetical protein
MQAVLIVGPLSKFLLRITLLDLGSVIQSDVLALAFFLAALCALLMPTRRYGRSVVVAGGVLLAAACLTRYAYVGAVLGTAIVLIAQWRRTRATPDRERAIAASVALLAAPVWIIGYQFLTHSGPAKQFRVHLTEVGQIGRLVVAWFGPDIQDTTFGTAILVILIAGAVTLAIRASDTFVRICAGTIVGYLAVHILTLQFLDASFAYAGERTLLLVRVLLLALIAVLIVRGLKALGNPRVGAAFVAALLATWLAVSGTSLFSAPLATQLSARTRHQLNPQRLPLLSNFADITYAQIRQPVTGLPTDVEYSTNRRLDVARQAADLVAVLRRQGTRFLVLVPSLLVQPIRLDQWPRCVQTKPLRTIAGTQRYELDVKRCSDHVVASRQ